MLIIQPAVHDSDFDHVYSIRSAVFLDELGMEEEEELDGLDHLAHHYLAILDGRAVATARWRLGPQVPVLRLERLAVLPAFRSQGIATKLVTRMMGDMHEDLPLETRSSLAAIPFFELLGFEKKGEPYEVGGVAIVDMAIGGGR